MAYFILIKETHFINLLYLPLQKGFESPQNVRKFKFELEWDSKLQSVSTEIKSP